MNRFLGRSHGILRGLDSVKSSPLFQGRFGRMFRRLPPAPFQEADLKALAAQMVAKPEATPTPETEDDDEENPGISAGYTYLGQFIDHDVTFDPASSLMKKNDPDALVDYRTPRFDLDNIYGRGPDDQPYLYAPDGLHMLLGNPLSGNPHDPKTTDLPRNASDPKRALIGDPRNDENTLVSQLQMIFLRFHNRVVDLLGPQADFDHASRMVRWHYQWIVLNDFLPTIVNETTIQSVLPHLKNKTSIAVDMPKIRYFHWKHEPFMPVEFSVAAYRFGHSMVRPGPLPEAVRELCAQTLFTCKIPFTNKRYRHLDLSAKMLFLASRDGVADTKKAYIDKFFELHRAASRDDISAYMQKASTVVNAMAKPFVDKDTLLRSVGMIILYFLLFERAIERRQIDMITRPALEGFEQLRKDNREKAETDIASADYNLLEFDRYTQSPNDAIAMRFRLAVVDSVLFSEEMGFEFPE